MPVRTMSSQSHTRRVESEELYKELLQGIDISAFFTGCFRSIDLPRMARASKLITLCLALVACWALHSLAFLSAPSGAQLRGSPSDVAVSVAATAAVPVLLTPEAAVAADGAPSVVLGVGILCMFAAFSAVSSVISATVTSELD